MTFSLIRIKKRPIHHFYFVSLERARLFAAMSKLALIVLLFVSMASFGATKTLNGDWSQAGDWSPSGLPSDGDDIIITGNSELPFQNYDVSLNNVTITVSSGATFTVNKKCDLDLDANSTVIVESGATIEGTHGNSVFTVGGSGNLLGNNTYNGPRAANLNGWNATSTTALPVELISFVAQMMEDRAHLEWETASETNNEYFEVERLINDTWITIGQVQGQGTSSQLHFYEYDDFDVNPYEEAYYRLKQVDYDGNTETFDVVRAEALQSQGHEYQVLRTNDRIELIFEDDHDEITEIMLIDAYGNVLRKEVFEIATKGQSVSFDLTEYPAGWYIVGISGTDNFHFEKMIKIE